MLFEVRNKNKDTSNKPIEEAIPIQLTRIERKYASSIEAYDKNRAVYDEQKWREKGTNHKEENGYITRELGQEDAWGVKLDTIESLVELDHKYGNFFLSRSPIDNKTPCIEFLSLRMWLN